MDAELPAAEPDPSAAVVDDRAPKSSASPTQVPGVTAIVVAHRSGPSLDDTLASLRMQDYGRLRIVVAGADGDRSLEERVRAIVPDAEVSISNDDGGFGSSVNAVVDETALSAFLLICHDDVALAPDVVRILVEEATRSNAGVVGPKFINWHNPGIIQDVGISIDKTGAPVPFVEVNELDQEQHDAVRDVFYTPAACMLIRSDLFRIVGGFDEVISFRGEDLDLCWRCHVAGARVVVAPDAVVRHEAQLETRRPTDDALGLRRRHQTRAMLANYSKLHLLRVVPQALFMTIFEAILSLFSGHTRRSRAVLGAWGWNARRIPSLVKRRRVIAEHRVVGDGDLRHLQVGGFAPVNTYLRDRRDGRGAVRGREMFQSITQRGPVQLALLVWGAVLAVVIFGSRHMLSDGLPIYGEFGSFGDSATDTISQWWSGWRDEGLGREAPAPIGNLLVGLASLLMFGKIALLRTVVIVGLPIFGAIGMWRLVRPFESPRAQAVGVVAFLANPLALNAVANGSLSALIMIGASPWVLAAFGRAAQQSPHGLYDGGRGANVPSPSIPREILTFGLSLGLMTAFVPFGLVLAGIMMLAFVVGSLLSGHLLGTGRMFVGSLGAVVLALALQLPSGLDALTGEWALLGGTRSDGGTELALADVLRFHVGPHGGSVLGWFLLAAAILPLLLARGARFAWAVRGWVTFLASVAVVMVAAQGLLPVGAPRPEVILAPAVSGLALATAMGMVAFEVDLNRYMFGWRQLVPVTALVALCIGVLPVVGASFDGRWEAPGRDFASVLEIVTAADAPAASRTLWIGDPDVVPMNGWEFEDGVIYATSYGMETTILDRWPGPSTDESRLIAEVIQVGLDGATSRLGTLLGPMAIRYIVVPERLAPAPDGAIERPAPEAIVAMLAEQLDLEQIELSPGVVVYRNTAFLPVHAAVAAGATDGTVGFRDAVGVDLDDGTPIFQPDDYRSADGRVVAGTDAYIAAAGAGWELETSHGPVARNSAFGWASSFAMDATGSGELRYDTPSQQRLFQMLQLLGWVVIVGFTVRLVSIEREGR